MAFRLGIEQGAQQQQQQQALEAQQQQKQMELAQANGLNGEQNGEEQATENGEEQGQVPQENGQENGQESELDQHINQLESMLGSGAKPEEVQKSVQEIVSLRKKEKFDREMKKSEKAIKGIAKALHTKEFKIGNQASHNMSDNAKKSVSMQHKIVNDIMKAWNEEEQKATSDINNILNIENLIAKK